MDKPWDGPAAEAKLKIPVKGTVGRQVYAWYDASGNDPDGDGYPDAKQDWALPHHEVASDGTPGAANVNGVRNALARLSGSRIPSSDEAAVRNHLQKHLDKFNQGKKSELDWEQARVLEVEGRIWALRPEVLSHIAAWDGLEINAEMRAEAEQMAAKASGPRKVGTTAVIPLKGVLMPQMGLLAMLFGLGSGLSKFRTDLRSAVADPDVANIVLDVDSPGGLVDHIPETAQDVRSANKIKPVTASVNTLAASAAYWLASQAGDVAITPSGEAGSIGVYSMHQDHSRRLEQLGVKHTFVSAGKYKTEGNPYEPLSSDAADAMQQAVNDYYGMFTRDVGKGRDQSVADVRDGFGEGRTLTAQRAVDAGLADRVEPLQATLSRLTRGAGNGRGRSLAADEIEALSRVMLG